MRSVLNSEGVALVVVLMAVALITALAVEFSYEVYVSTSALQNWQTSQRLSLAAKSAARLAAKAISDAASGRTYTYPGSMELTYENPIEKSGGLVIIRAEDENSKFNLNKLLLPNQTIDIWQFQAFKRLLRALKLNENIAERVADWIDSDLVPLIGNSEEGAKNSPLDSVDELYYMGIDNESIKKLLPYVTIYGDGTININGAEAPVLISLSEKVDEAVAEQIIRYREGNHFEKKEDLQPVVGGSVYIALPLHKLTTKGSVFRILSTATSSEIKRVIECVVEIPSGVIRYWKET